MLATSPIMLLLAAAEQNGTGGSVLGFVLLAMALFLLLCIAVGDLSRNEPPEFEPFEESQALAPLAGPPPDEQAGSRVTVEIDEVDVVLLRPPPNDR